MLEHVFVVEHEHELSEGCDDVKLIGVYESEEDAEKAVERAKQRPGFRGHPEGFSISSYKVGEDQWTTGFVTLLPQDS
jgi:hypothetical protein